MDNDRPSFDVVIAGGGPAGLSAALTFGRARKRVLLCDAGPRRNAAATHIHTFVTRDGTPPDEFRRVAREQLRAYPSVAVHDTPVTTITGQKEAFEVASGETRVRSRRVLLCTGMVDVLPDLDGLRELWGGSVFQCPYCHGWEVRDRRFAYLAPDVDAVEFALLLGGWSPDMMLFTDARFDVPVDQRQRLARAGIPVEERRIVRLAGAGARLERIEVAGGGVIARDVLFMHPPQRQVPVVEGLGLELDPHGYVRVDDATLETSIPGIHAAGDLVTKAQAALLGAAAGMRAATAINYALTIAMAVSSGETGR
jgi:thioredoxin reductase